MWVTFKFLIESEASVDGIWALDAMLMTFSWWSKPFGPSITLPLVHPFLHCSFTPLSQRDELFNSCHISEVFNTTRPKPAYGRQGLDWIVGPGYSFVVFSTRVRNSISPPQNRLLLFGEIAAVLGLRCLCRDWGAHAEIEVLTRRLRCTC